MEPTSSLFSTAKVICFPDQKTPCSVQLVPKKYSTPFSFHCCCVIPSYKEPLQSVEPAAALCQLAALPCSVGAPRAKHRHSQGWSNPSLHWEDHILRNTCRSSCLLPSYPPQTKRAQLLQQTKEKWCRTLPTTAAHCIVCKESPKSMCIYVAGVCIFD